MLVVLEWFGSAHSIYRTHSRTMEAAREHFEVVAMGYAHCVDSVSQQVFDSFVALDETKPLLDQLRHIQAEAERRQAQLLYMPSVGMFPLTMFAANLRVAPLQVMALGHPATAHALAIDAVVVEEDYLGDPGCFSEKLLRLPPDGMPYRPAPNAAAAPRAKVSAQGPQQVQIALCAAAMKFNPELLSACATIAARSRVRVHFHLLVGQAQGLMVPAFMRLVRQALGQAATVWPEQPVEDYRAVVARCDFFINPFPFGNTNGTIDCIAAGLVGVCKTGPEVHEHIDEGMFRRLGLPEWLITRSVEEYVQAAIRLAESHAERAELSARLAGPDKVSVFYTGRPAIMGGLLLQELQDLPA
jgi:predicted O-linked N-acetylglucosamine transferase (SPINDLY family)